MLRLLHRRGETTTSSTGWTVSSPKATEPSAFANAKPQPSLCRARTADRGLASVKQLEQCSLRCSWWLEWNMLSTSLTTQRLQAAEIDQTHNVLGRMYHPWRSPCVWLCVVPSLRRACMSRAWGDRLRPVGACTLALLAPSWSRPHAGAQQFFTARGSPAVF